MRIVVAYDISWDAVLGARRRASGGRALPRVLKSVFEGSAPEEVHQRCMAKVLRLIGPDRDRVRVYRLCASCARRVESYGHAAVDGGDFDDAVRVL